MKLFLTTLLTLLTLVANTDSRAGIREYKHSVRIDGRTYPADSVWVEGKRTFWIGVDGIYYGVANGAKDAYGVASGAKDAYGVANGSLGAYGMKTKELTKRKEK